MISRRCIGRLLAVVAVAGCSLGVPGAAKAVLLAPDNQFVLDFVANGDGSTSLSNLEVAVYWRWDGGTTFGIRMETPNTSVGFGNFWSFNVFNGASAPGGIDSSNSNNTHTVISAGGAFSATSLGAFGSMVDAIEATWMHPGFDPLLDTVYIQLSMFGPSGPSDGYRMADYLAGGGTYANAPDILSTGFFCEDIVGNCALLTFEAVAAPEPGTLGGFAFGLAGLSAIAWRRRRASVAA